jgi:hypothetical protein
MQWKLYSTASQRTHVALKTDHGYGDDGDKVLDIEIRHSVPFEPKPTTKTALNMILISPRLSS